jgi:hypothetical protein
MKHLIILVLALTVFRGLSQPDTEVFIFDLTIKNGQVALSNHKNISNNVGYDNQPSFVDDNTVLFAGTRQGQTDIAKYNIRYDSRIWINHTAGSEYSPLLIPNQKAVSSIRLEKNGDQKLYRYDLKNGDSEILIEDIIIGYHTWFDEHILLSSVLEDDWLALYRTDIATGKDQRIDRNIGRSLYRIPNSDRISYISKMDSTSWEIKSYRPSDGSIKTITSTLPGMEDMCWTPDGTILMGKENTLYAFHPGKDKDWKEIATFKSIGITDISRLAVNPGGTKLALVGVSDTGPVTDIYKILEPTLENIAWISGNWKGKALGGIVEENWSHASGGSMMATFRLIKDGTVAFYEIEIIRELENSLVLQLKHFNSDLTGWETKDETVDFPLKEITANKVVFEGMSFERVGDNEMHVSVNLGEKNGAEETIKFKYTKQL